jgi:hypothetical protein
MVSKHPSISPRPQAPEDADHGEHLESWDRKFVGEQRERRSEVRRLGWGNGNGKYAVRDWHWWLETGSANNSGRDWDQK